MFLSMLTADAAAQHGHEFSTLRVEGTQRRSPIPRYPLRTISASRQRQLHGLPPHGPAKRPPPPTRSQSLKLAMTELREVPEETDDANDVDSLRLHELPGSYPSGNSSLIDVLPVEPVQESKDEEQEAQESACVAEPVTSLSTLIEERLSTPSAKRTPRPKDHYRLAHPPPLVGHKPLQPLQRHLRPRVLLQLQQRTSSGFHKPVYEVVPASRFSTDTRLGKKLNRLRKAKDGLQPDDLVVLEVEDYRGPDDISEEAEFSESRTAVGIISVLCGRNGQTEDSAFLYLENSTWKASPGKGGGYEFVLQDDSVQKARWYLPKSKRKRPTSVSGPPVPLDVERQKYYFAMIQPHTTLHPTIASINDTHLDVYSHYAAASSSPRSGTRTPSAPVGDGMPSTPTEMDDASQLIPTSELLRKLIIVSGTWLFFAKGWSPYFKIFHNLQPTINQSVEPRPLHLRSVSIPVGPLSSRLCPRAKQRDASPSSISKTSSGGSAAPQSSDETPPTSTLSGSTAATSTPSDVPREATESIPSPSRRQPSSTQAYDATPTLQRNAPEPTEAVRDEACSDSDVPIQSPSYWQAYDLFHERSFQQQVEQLETSKMLDLLTVPTPSEQPPTVQAKPTLDAETFKQEAKPRRTLSLRNRVLPYLSMIKSVRRKRPETQ